jgi:hypothetical protein
MKKILLMAVAALMATSVFAHETIKKVRVYKDNAVVYESNYSDVDSIVFVDEIIPDVPDLPTGALTGEFSVSATKKVHFSRGNLQASTTDLGVNWTWDFAEHQWDYIGEAAANNAINGNKTVSSNGAIDLFCWSITDTYYGINNSMSSSTYSGDFRDWGETIGEGWHTLSGDEWVYLFFTRTNAESLFGLGSVNGVNGTIILPDNWVTPEGALFTPSTTQGLAGLGDFYYNSNGDNFSHNTYTAEQWGIMESAGAVFLPAAGNRYGANVYNGGSRGYYWSASYHGHGQGSNVIDVYFNSNYMSMDYCGRDNGLSVRLVQDL